uniref:Uncharacterized protein n=1 Tax=Meloidogyne javanica TaxID=6303 RepID=A0A915LC11_MELJA
MTQRPSTGCDTYKKTVEEKKISKAERFKLQRRTSLPDFDLMELVSPKNLKILAPVFEKYKQFTPMEFVKEAKVYYDSSPPDLIRTAAMLWFGSMYAVKMLFLHHGINIVSHGALEEFCAHALIQSPIIDKAGIWDGTDNWESAELWV